MYSYYLKCRQYHRINSHDSHIEIKQCKYSVYRLKLKLHFFFLLCCCLKIGSLCIPVFLSSDWDIQFEQRRGNFGSSNTAEHNKSCLSHCLVMSSDCCCTVTVGDILKEMENPTRLTGIQALDPEGEEVHIFWTWSEGYAFWIVSLSSSCGSTLDRVCDISVSQYIV